VEAAEYLNKLEPEYKFASSSVGNATRIKQRLNGYSFQFADSDDLPNEIWKKVPLNPKEYDKEVWVSNFGRYSRGEHDKRIFPKPDKNVENYGIRITITTTQGTNSSKSLHELVAMAFIPNENGYRDVYHRNKVKTDNRVENLYWSTKKVETQHLVADGIVAGYGTIAIKQDSGETFEFDSQAKAAEFTGVSSGNVSNIIAAAKNNKILHCNGWTFLHK
jgi:hypothetical protein